MFDLDESRPRRQIKADWYYRHRGPETWPSLVKSVRCGWDRDRHRDLQPRKCCRGDRCDTKTRNAWAELGCPGYPPGPDLGWFGPFTISKNGIFSFWHIESYPLGSLAGAADVNGTWAEQSKARSVAAAALSWFKPSEGETWSQPLFFFTINVS